MQETQEMQVQSLGEEDPPEEEMSTHSSGTQLSDWTATTELDWGLRKSLGLSLMAGGQAGLPSPLLAQLTDCLKGNSGPHMDPCCTPSHGCQMSSAHHSSQLRSFRSLILSSIISSLPPSCVSAIAVISGLYMSLSKSLVPNTEQVWGQFSGAYLCTEPRALAWAWSPVFVP